MKSGLEKQIKFIVSSLKSQISGDFNNNFETNLIIQSTFWKILKYHLDSFVRKGLYIIVYLIINLKDYIAIVTIDKNCNVPNSPFLSSRTNFLNQTTFGALVYRGTSVLGRRRFRFVGSFLIYVARSWCFLGKCQVEPHAQLFKFTLVTDDRPKNQGVFMITRYDFN